MSWIRCRRSGAIRTGPTSAHGPCPRDVWSSNPTPDVRVRCPSVPGCRAVRIPHPTSDAREVRRARSRVHRSGQSVEVHDVDRGPRAGAGAHRGRRASATATSAWRGERPRQGPRRPRARGLGWSRGRSAQTDLIQPRRDHVVPRGSRRAAGAAGACWQRRAALAAEGRRPAGRASTARPGCRRASRSGTTRGPSGRVRRGPCVRRDHVPRRRARRRRNRRLRRLPVSAPSSTPRRSRLGRPAW